MSQRTSTQRRAWKERALSLLLAAALVVGLVPGLTLPVSAAHWADAYLDQLVDQGILRADQTADPDAELSRAEFMAIVNRAYGYTETGPIPFTDVLPTDWFYDDISIAYTAGYMAGTSATTASPNDTLTREQAFCILGRNMMMKETPGESLAFADSRDISDWARGTIKTAVDNYVVSGYPDNTLHPKASISKGQMAALVTQCLGVPIQQSGTYELGGVFGNVTITAPDVTLRNTTISGDLYISGGVGLGGIKLENVDVLGRIIVSGTGESEGGDASVIMRNVTANEMLVDNMRNKTVTIRADGITDIAQTIVRTNAYLEDNNTDDKGLMRIELSGAPGIRLTLAGRIKEVVDKTPSSYIQLAKGTVAKLTVDEAATSSTVQIDRNTKVNEVNLDVATSVLGDGDIGQLNVNAPGSVVSMLPDKIYVRPGLNATIAGVVMDYQAAQEGSLDPRLLSGYPAANDVAPTGFRADFAGNKKGTVYWAVSYVSDGSIGENDLISPPSYGNKAIVNGSVEAPAGGDEVSAQVSNLVVGGSYYLSAILVDEQKERSPVKVISFSTPDNTVPAFAQGYPYMSRTTSTVAQVTVMPSKSCKLYYALLPQGAQTPTPNELKAAAVAGNLGYGVRDVTKNTEEVFTVNNQRLEELKNYVLYLWLTDTDGANSSAVVSLSFTVPDETPPVVDPIPYPAPDGTTGTSISMRTGLNEAGIVFWAVVKQGVNYPLPNQQSSPLSRDNIVDPETGNALSAKLDTDFAKLGVANGRGALVRGQVNVANADTEVTFNIQGLEPETSYDLYYVGRDNTQNYSAEVKKITISTLDTNGPIVYQYFTEFQGDDPTERPMANSDVILRFNENITVNGSTDLYTLYEVSQGRGDGRDNPTAQNQATTQLLTALKEFKLYQRNAANGRANPVTIIPDDVTNDTDDIKDSLLSWIDYRNVLIRRVEDSRGIEIVFRNGINISLASNTTYYFELANISDNAETKNRTVPGTLSPTSLNNFPDTEHVLKEFTTVFALVDLAAGGGSSQPPKWVPDSESNPTNKSGQMQGDAATARMDANFYVTPQSTKDAGDTYCFDIVFFAERAVSFDLYYRIVDAINTNTVYKPDSTEFEANKIVIGTQQAGQIAENEENGWVYLGNKATSKGSNSDWETGDMSINILHLDRSAYPKLNNLGEDVSYEFAISVTKWENIDQYESWDDKFNFRVYMVAGPSGGLYSLLASPDYTPEDILSTETQNLNVYSIGVPDFVTLPIVFVASAQPVFMTHPEFEAGDTFQNITFGLDNPGTLYYVIAPRSQPIPTKITLKEAVEGVAVEVGGQIDTTVSLPTSREYLWAVVSAQTDLENRGELKEKDTDTEHLEYYRVEGTPDRDLIPRGRAAFPSNICGSFDYEGMAGATQTFTVPDPDSSYVLDPLGEYYIYIVLEAASHTIESRSNVYIFNFKTTDTAKPRITIAANQGNEKATLQTFVGTSTAVEADLAWRVFTGIQGREEINELGPVVIPEELKITCYGDLNEDTGDYEVSVMYALKTKYNAGEAFSSTETIPDGYGPEKNDFTVFDVFADPNLKFNLDRVVRYGQVSSSVIGSSTDVPVYADTGFQYDFTWWFAELENSRKMEYYPQEYIMLVVGHNKNSKTEPNSGWSTVDSFAAADPIFNNKSAPPQLTSTTSGNIIEVHTSENAPTTYSGTITIQFDKNVYWLEDQNATPIEVVPGGDSDISDDYISILYGNTLYKQTDDTKVATIPEKVPETIRPQSVFTINFTKIPASTITFLPIGIICDENGNMAVNTYLQMTIRDVVESSTGPLTMRRAYIEVKFGGESFTFGDKEYYVPTN